ncbi:MAG: hypothetical protein COA50_05045 [Flavobacteriaceae bacterium]|nr:MAG: hypothetical protein COA50_05045 [Flavobacteriaceae bacterium]
MAPIKFENEIRDKLSTREMKPSANAWEQISEKLETPNNTKKGWIWYAVAASFIGLIVISALFFNDEDALMNKGVEIVDAPEKKDIKKNEIDIVTPTKEQEENYVVVEEIVSIKEKVGKEEKIQFNSSEQGIVAVNTKTNVSIIKEEVPLTGSEKIIDSKIAEVLAQVNLLEKDNTLVTDMEVNALLRKAQMEILTDKIFMENQKVDAIALLTEVESELDQTFRDQIFDSLKSGFLKVRTAVADRNN